MPESNIKQAMFPSEAIILNNKLGTAPGMYLFKDQKTIVLLPGPPKEMKKMFIDEVEPLLQKNLKPGKKAVTRIIKVFGPGESQVEEMIAEVMENPQGCSLALLAVDGEIHIRITAEGQDSEASKKILTNLTEKIEQKMGANIYGYDDDTLTSIVAELINKRGLTLAAAESCTGGYLAKTITDLPGSSSYFWGAAITYSNEAKNRLIGVDTNTISTYGAVSKETALEMAQGIKKLSGSSIGIALTGIAGPQGATETKPAGLVYIAIVSDNIEKVKELKFTGDREGVRILAVKTALDIVRRNILSY
jgi:nicotinamide-nucleotide amidase